MKYFHKDNEKLENKVNKFFLELSNLNKAHFKGALSVVLLGSLSRGEGSWCTNPDGSIRLLSDIEFFTVHPNGFNGRKLFDEDISIAAREAFGNEDSPFFHIDNTYICKTHLPKLEKKLLTYDAISFGKCVVGEDIIQLFPTININNINYVDIKDILVHRIFSVLYYGHPLKITDKLNEYQYSLAKNSLDLMTVLLVNSGILESGFEQRLKRINSLDIEEKLKKYFKYCLNIKYSEYQEEQYTIEKMEELFIDLIVDLSNNFHIPMKTYLYNFTDIIKRKMGVFKRGLKYKHVSFSQEKHLMQLVSVFKNNESLKKKNILSNLVLNGYPVESEV